jgi:hypothetical protein
MSARRGDKSPTTNEDRMVEKEAEQLEKQHQQSKRQVVSRQSAERQGMQIFHMNQVSCARSDAKGSEEKLREVHELELRLLIEEHDLIMGHFQESGELEVEHLEQEHFQTMNHQGIVHKSQLDQIQAKVAQTQDRIKQRFSKFLFPHYEKKCQLEREQQQEMQKAEQLELNRQAQTEYKKFQKQKQEDLKKKKDYIKAAQVPSPSPSSFDPIALYLLSLFSSHLATYPFLLSLSPLSPHSIFKSPFSPLSRPIS